MADVILRSAAPSDWAVAAIINGEPVGLVATYRIAANNFIANGDDGYSLFKETCASGAYCRDTGILALDLLVEEFKAGSPVVRSIEGRIVVGP